MNDFYINFLVFVFVFCIYYLENRVPFVKLFGFVDTLGAIIEYLVFLISCLSQIAQFWCRMSPGVWEEKWSSTWTLEQTLFSCSSSTNRYLSLLGMDCRLGCCLLMKVCMYDKCWMSDFMIKCPLLCLRRTRTSRAEQTPCRTSRAPSWSWAPSFSSWHTWSKSRRRRFRGQTITHKHMHTIWICILQNHRLHRYMLYKPHKHLPLSRRRNVS